MKVLQYLPSPIMANTRLQHGSFSSSYRVVTNMFLTQCHFGAEVMYSTWTQVMYSTNQAKYQLSEEHLVTFVAPPTYAACMRKNLNVSFSLVDMIKNKTARIPCFETQKTEKGPRKFRQRYFVSFQQDKPHRPFLLTIYDYTG